MEGRDGMDGVPAVEFAAARGGRIAYQQFGAGDETIVAIPPAAQNIELGWERAEVRAMLERFGSFSRYLHFDKRGTGSSDRGGFVPGIDERVDDLRAVMDHAGIDRAHLFAQSEGGPTTLLFAATYPHRVQSVILFGSGARIPWDDGTPDAREVQLERRAAFAEVWGTPDSRAVDLFAPSRADDEEFRRWHVRYERSAASADSLLDLLIQMLDMDVRDVLDQIDAPVLVMHRRDDQSMPIVAGREVADAIPHARFVEFDGIDHFAYLGDIDGWMTEIERFVTGSVTPRPAAPPPVGARVTTLGRFAVSVDGAEIETAAWGSRRARLVLKRLIVARGWPVTREEMIDLLWPDETDLGRLGARLSVQLSAVRRVLGGGIIADRQTIALDREHVAVDLDELFDATTDAEVVARYTGEFLPENRYDDWTAPLRDDVRSRFAMAGHREIVRLTSGGEHAAAAALARRLIDADPFDGRAHEARADALEAAGDPAGARRARETWNRTLADL